MIKYKKYSARQEKVMDAVASEGECTTRIAAKLLGVSLRTVQLWVESDVLKAWKTPGGHRRVSMQSVNDLITERTEATKPRKAACPVMRILIVEDNLALSRMYQATIRSWGLPVEVDAVNDGFDALVSIGANTPDIVILDISMPGMDGISLLRKLRGSHQYDEMEIIVVTGLDTVEIEKRGGVPDGISVFLKPAPFAMIQARIQELANLKLGGGVGG